MEYISVPSALIAMLQITNRYIAEKEQDQDLTFKGAPALMQLSDKDFALAH